MKLCFVPGACSLAVHIALREVGARFDTMADARTHVDWASLLGLPRARISSRPAAQDARRAEGLLK